MSDTRSAPAVKADEPESGGVGTVRVHPAAAAFPLMTEAEFADLVEDIRANGLRHPVVYHEGNLLDGRNRVRACALLGIVPSCIEWGGSGSPASYVVSSNLIRRNLTPSQKSMVAAELKPVFAAEAKERQRESGREVHRGQPKKKAPVNSDGSYPTPKRHDGESRTAAAKAVGVAPAYVSTAERIKRADPVLAEKVKAGEVTIRQAIRKIDGPTIDEEVDREPGMRWARFLADLMTLINSVRKAGGLASIAKRWTPEQREHYAKQLKRMADYLLAFEKEIA